MLAYLRRHHIGLLALFVALGGTSYAAAKLPRNSVDTPQLRAAAVTTAKLAPGVRKQLGKPAATGAAGPQGAPGPAGPQGAAGPPGPRGETGAKGPQGETGAIGPQGIPGPTSAGVGGINTNIVIGGVSSGVGSPASVTLTQPGKVLVLVTGTFSVRCSAADRCDRTITATVGETPVPGLFATIEGDAGVNTEDTITATGIVANVAPGTHAVQIGSRITGPSNGSGSRGDVRIVAVALGG